MDYGRHGLPCTVSGELQWAVSSSDIRDADMGDRRLVLGGDEDSGLFGGGPPKVCGLFRWNTGLAGDSPLGFIGSKPSTSAGVPCGDIDGAFGARAKNVP